MLSGSVTITIPKIHSPPYLTMNNAEENSQVPCDGATFDWQALLTQVIADFGCVTGTLHRFDLTDQHLKLVAHQGIPEVLMPVVQSIPIGKGIAGAAAQTRQPVEMCNLQTDTSGVAKPGAKQTQVQGSLAVPVLDGERLCGTLGIGKMVPYEFSEEEKDRLLTIAAGLAQRLAAIGR
jgi:putative methionine-R-sulfoxide reductase with GAF domain